MNADSDFTELIDQMVPIYIRLDAETGLGGESAFAEVLKQDGESLIAALRNYCFFAPLAYDDVVRLELNADMRWQVTEILERGGLHTYVAFLVPDGDLDYDRDSVDRLEEKLFRLIDSNVETLFPNREETEFAGVASGAPIAPFAIIAMDPLASGMDPEEALDLFESILGEIMENLGIDVEKWVDPGDLGHTNMVLDLVDVPSYEATGSTYDAFSDPAWDDEVTIEDIAIRDIFLHVVNHLAQVDDESAADLESGRYERVKEIAFRILNDERPEPALR
jgi:hypothetical protein